MPSFLEVAVAVIHRRGEVLLAKRPQGKKHAGCWEFPGGKFESGESLAQALGREIYEELGIHITEHQELMEISHTYSDYSVLLRVALVSDFSGEALGREGQEIAWVAFDALDSYSFPEANSAILDKLKQLDISSA